MMNDCLFYCLDECLRPLSARLKHVLTEISFLCPLFCAVNSPLIDLEEEIGVPAIEMWLYTVSLSSLLLSSSRPDILLTQHFKEDLSRYVSVSAVLHCISLYPALSLLPQINNINYGATKSITTL